MSRLRFARSLGAKPNNPYNAWSYVNHIEKFVLFGAWKNEEQDDRQLIFSKNWNKNAKGRKPAAYMPSLRHLELVIEEGYKLKTFRQYMSSERADGIPKVDRFDAVSEDRNLVIVGSDYFAVFGSDNLDDKAEVEPTEFLEGKRLSVLQTHYERSPQAREKCLEIHKSACIVCNFDFGREFGDHGRGFIHVHHLVPVSQRGTTYRVTPETDLVPVCPNCHAMLHRRNKLISVEELLEIREDAKRRPNQ